MMLRIIIKNLKLYGYHGVNPEEKIEGQEFLFNIDVGLRKNLPSPAASEYFADHISSTVNYSELVDLVKSVNQEAKYDLLETLALKIAENIFAHSLLISEVMVRV